MIVSIWYMIISVCSAQIRGQTGCISGTYISRIRTLNSGGGNSGSVPPRQKLSKPIAASDVKWTYMKTYTGMLVSYTMKTILSKEFPFAIDSAKDIVKYTPRFIDTLHAGAQ